MKTILYSFNLFILLLPIACFGQLADEGPASCTRLFFSEYVEGSSRNKAVEIYNPTLSEIDLANHEIHSFNNGAFSYSYRMQLEGKLGAGEVYVIANSSSDDELLSLSDTTGAIAVFNGNDALLLINSITQDTLDIIGVIAEDPEGGSWNTGEGGTAEYTLVRKYPVSKGTAYWTESEGQWDVFPQNTFGNLGNHTSQCHVALASVSSQPDHLLSVYFHGSGLYVKDSRIRRKKISIYNTKGQLVKSFSSNKLYEVFYPSLPASGYIVRVVANDIVLEEKILVQ